MVGVVVLIDAWDPVAGAAVQLRAGSHDTPEVCHLDGATWWPALAKLPTLRYDLFDGAFGGQITAPSSSLTLRTEPWPAFGGYQLADARLRLWTGEIGAGFGAWTLRFDGRITAQPVTRDGSADIAFAVDDRWLDAALLPTYAGTTGAEGPASLKGQVKPLSIGAPRYVSGALVDTINSVFQVSAFAINAVEAALERLARFGAPQSDYADYAALVAAPLKPGTWATAKMAGLVRFGAPPAGLVSFLVQGDAAGLGGWVRRPGKVIRRLAQLAGGADRVDQASLDALDAARPYNVSIYADQQTTARELIQGLAASFNCVAGVTWTGSLFVVPVAIGAAGAADVVLAADGSALPPVEYVQQLEQAAPFRKLGLQAERTWTVHALADIASYATLVDLGAYSATTVYREGNIVQSRNISWRHLNPTPSSGNAPPAAPAIEGLYWRALSPPVTAAGVPLEQLIADAQAAGDNTIVNSTFQPDTSGWTLTGFTRQAAPAGSPAAATLLFTLDNGAQATAFTEKQAVSARRLHVSGWANSGQPIVSINGRWYRDGSDAVAGTVSGPTNLGGAGWKNFGGWVDLPADAIRVDWYWQARNQTGSAQTGQVTAMRVAASEPGATVGATSAQVDAIVAAQAAAASAQASASAAVADLSDLANDGVLTPAEKIQKLIPLDAQLEAAWSLLDGQAAPIASATSARTDAANARYAWAAYRNALSPAWNNTALDTAVTRTTFNNKLSDYDYALRALADALRAAAQAKAVDALAVANSAVADLSDLANDGVLTPTEKIQKLIPNDAALEAVWSMLDAQAAAAGAPLAAARTVAANARTGWQTYRNSLSPAWNNIGLDTAVTRATYNGKLGDYDFGLRFLAEVLRQFAGTTANWSGVGNDNGQRPADGATADIRLVAGGNKPPTISGGAVTGTSTAGSWDGYAGTAAGIVGPCAFSGRVAGSGQVMLGLSAAGTVPAGSTSTLSNMLLAVYRAGAGCYTFGGGNVRASLGSYSDTTVWTTGFDGSRLFVAANGTIVDALAYTTSAALFGAVATLKRNVSYLDIAQVPTSCYGHTGRDVVVGQYRSDAQCEALLRQDAAEHLAGALACSPELADRPQQLAAVTRLTFNIGVRGYCTSSIQRHFAAGRWRAGCDRFLAYRFAGGREVRGLLLRRQRERAQCLVGVPA